MRDTKNFFLSGVITGGISGLMAGLTALSMSYWIAQGISAPTLITLTTVVGILIGIAVSLVLTLAFQMVLKK